MPGLTEGLKELWQKNPVIVLGGVGAVALLGYSIFNKGSGTQAPLPSDGNVTYQIYPASGVSGGGGGGVRAPSRVPQVACGGLGQPPCNPAPGPMPIPNPYPQPQPSPQPSPQPGPGPTPEPGPGPVPRPAPPPGPPPNPEVICQAGYHWNGTACVPDAGSGPGIVQPVDLMSVLNSTHGLF